MRLFERLSERSRRARFNGAKPCLRTAELRELASVDERHRTLVAFVGDDPEPAGMAQLVRDGDSAEIAFAVADEYQRQGIGSALASRLVADARADGVAQITALVARDNPAALALLRHTLGRLRIAFEGTSLSIRAAL
jgi:ribosomal protein S18 acetylase RimI-like enzyme